ncbi:hypothetical protein TNCV_2530091, partial [Trichonephila clavipes]
RVPGRQHHSRCPVTNGRDCIFKNSNLLRRVYHHIPVEPSDIGKSLPPGHHSNCMFFPRMTFDLRNAAQTFTGFFFFPYYWDKILLQLR